MAWTFPVSLASFLDGLRISGATFDLSEASETLTLGSGEILTASLGTRLWYGSVTLAVQTWAQHEEAMALLRVLQRPGASFLLSPLHGRTTGANGVLNAVQNGREVRLSGVGANRVLPRRTFLSFPYTVSSVSRFAFHQLAEAVTADGTGLTPFAEVVPALRPGWALSAAVQLQAPVLKAVVVPGSVRGGSFRSVLAEGISFDWMQTLR